MTCEVAGVGVVSCVPGGVRDTEWQATHPSCVLTTRVYHHVPMMLGYGCGVGAAVVAAVVVTVACCNDKSMATRK